MRVRYAARCAPGEGGGCRDRLHGTRVGFARCPVAVALDEPLGVVARDEGADRRAQVVEINEVVPLPPRRGLGLHGAAGSGTFWPE